MAAAVSLTINLRDGSSHTISQPASSDHKNVRYDQLIKSISTIQEQANNILTTLVNKEKSQKNSTDYCVDDSKGDHSDVAKSGVLETNSSGNETDGTTDDDEEEDEDDDSTNKPPKKKQKT